MRPDGGGIEQLTFDDRVNWFPHVSPDGRSVVFISYPAGTTGHPPNKDVILRFMRPDGSNQRDLVAFLGGQGTINVNSWAPDSSRLPMSPIRSSGKARLTTARRPAPGCAMAGCTARPGARAALPRCTMPAVPL